MREVDCDVAVIGAGTAGIAAHRAALEAGVRSVLIEQGPGGTTCARVGCMPSKLLIAAAAAAHDARDAGSFGIRVEGVRVDGRAVLKRVRGFRDRFVGAVFESLEKFPEESRISGRAAFADADRLCIDDHTRLRFKTAVLATGSSPIVPDPLDAVQSRVLTTDTVFEIKDLPASIAVLGGGPVGLELAQSFARLGVRTSLFDPSAKLGGLSDPDLCRAARDVFQDELDLHLGAKVVASEPAEDGAELRWSYQDGREGSGTFERVLAAAGRPPNLRGLRLDAAGVRLDDTGSPVFDPCSLACEGAPLFIAGDANGERAVLHEASRQGRIAGRNAAALARGGKGERPERWVNLAMVFTHPQIALVGQAYDADAAGDWLIGGMSFCDQGRAQVMARDQGGVRLYAERSGRLIGAQMIGPDVEHLGHLLAYAIQDGHTAASLKDRPIYHPTLEEGLETALSEIARQVGA